MIKDSHIPQRATTITVSHMNFLYFVFFAIRKYVESADNFVQVIKMIY